jgi:hypothetical protein
MWAHPDVCRLVANNLGSFAVNLGYTPSIVAVNLGNSTPMIAGRTSDVCKPLQLGRSCPLPRASARHLCSVPSDIPSARANCRMAMLCGGSICFSTEAFRSGEYPKSSSYPAHLRNRGKVEQRTTSLTQGDPDNAPFIAVQFFVTIRARSSFSTASFLPTL